MGLVCWLLMGSSPYRFGVSVICSYKFVMHYCAPSRGFVPFALIVSFHFPFWFRVHKMAHFTKGVFTSVYCSLFKFTFVLKSVLLFLKLFVIECLLGVSETFLCSVSALQVEIIPLIDALQMLMLFVQTWGMWNQKFFSESYIIRAHLNYTILIVFKMYTYIFKKLLSQHNCCNDCTNWITVII